MNREEAVKIIKNTEQTLRSLSALKDFSKAVGNIHEVKIVDMAIELIKAYEFIYKPHEFYPTPVSPEYFECVMNKAGEGFHKFYTNQRIDDLYKKLSDIEKRLDKLNDEMVLS